MSIEINEVVKSYVFDAHGHMVHARITTYQDGYSWDVSHFRINERSKQVKPEPNVAKTIEEALGQLQAYINEYLPGHRPYENVHY